MCHRGRLESARINPFNVPVYRTRVHKRVVIHHCNAATSALIHVRNIVDAIHCHVVVDVCDLHHGYASVSYVHILNITRTGPIPWDVNFSRSQREPAYPTSNAYPYAEATAANECN